MAEPVTADIAEQLTAAFEKLVLKLRANGDSLVPLSRCHEYTTLSYQQCHRLCKSGELAYTQMPFGDQIYVCRSQLRAAKAPPRGRPPKIDKQ